MPPNSVFVCHPGLQHAHQLALAVHEQGLLQAFWSGVPVTDTGADIAFWLPKSYKQRIRSVSIPATLRRHPLTFQVLAKAGALLPTAMRSDHMHRVFHAFDWWISRQIPHLKPKVVVAYENAAYHTFEAARRVGAKCILDAPSLEHQAGSRLMSVPDTPYTDEINRRKDVEVQTADLILTCSPLAAQSYVDSGVQREKVHSLLLGAELPVGVRIQFREVTEPRFIFAGVLSHRKSIDLILKVFRRMHESALAAKVEFVGYNSDPEFEAAIKSLPNASHHPNVPQTRLFEMLSRADCLLLPSRFDSFGMVVAEAMACGTPAIVSTQTGAKAIIERYPSSGWIVEPEENALFKLVSDLVASNDKLAKARKYALEAASDFTWQRYRQRAGILIKEFVSR